MIIVVPSVQWSGTIIVYSSDRVALFRIEQQFRSTPRDTDGSDNTQSIERPSPESTSGGGCYIIVKSLVVIF